MKSAYFHCIGGASGDMILGALVDAGLAVDDLRDTLASLRTEGWTLSAHTGQRSGVRGTLVAVELDEAGRRPRRWQDFVDVVQKSHLSSGVIERATAVFRRLAEAEATVHGVPAEEVHLHELGTLDTLIDVVGGVAGLELLGVDRLFSSPLPSGSGLVKSEHGVLPVPTPATAALFALGNAPVVRPPVNAPDTGEMVTPTGAAMLTTLATFRQPSLTVERVGYGLGSRDSRYYPNVLALWVGDDMDVAHSGALTVIETNIDDMSSEVLGYVQERLFDLGARDVWFTPIQMKKNRPGVMLSAIVPGDLESRAVTLVLRETSTLGVRVRSILRYEADRDSVEVDTSLGPAWVKVKRLKGANVAVSPEYESCRHIALERGIPLQDVMHIVRREAEERLI